MNDKQLMALAVTVGQRLLATGASVTMAESCTGGWIARVVTDVAGSSGWFNAALVTYSDAMKHELLGVSEATLARDGAVSEAVVCEMAIGARALAHADWSIAVSGIAGPDGGTLAKPVGLVWFAWSSVNNTTAARHRFSGDREAIRRAAVACALGGLLERL